MASGLTGGGGEPLRFEVVTIFPELFQPFVTTSIVGRGVAKGRARIRVHDLRDFTRDRHRTVDDYPYGGGAGMLMRVDPFHRCLESIRGDDETPPYVVLMSARGELFDQKMARELSLKQRLVILCGHYKGIDERVASFADREVSIGDYVLSGGEVPAMVVIDAVVRLLPGVVGDFASVEEDSHFDGLLSYPEYTRPREYLGMGVPEVLLGGDHARIQAWREAEALAITRRRRPDLYRRHIRAVGTETTGAHGKSEKKKRTTTTKKKSTAPTKRRERSDK